MAADDQLLAADLISHHWSRMVRENGMLVRRVLRELGDEAYERQPTLAFVAELFEPPSESPAIRERIVRTVEALDRGGTDPGAISQANIMVVTLRRHGEYERAARLGQEFAEILRSMDVGRGSRANIAGLYVQTGFAHLLMGDLATAVRFYLDAYRTSAPLPNYAVDAASKIALIAALRGEHAVARQWIDLGSRLTAEAETWWYSAYEVIGFDLAEAIMALDRLDFASFRRIDQRLNALLPDEVLAFVIAVRSRAALLMGTQRIALVNVRAHRRDYPGMVPEVGLPRILLDIAEAELLMSLSQMSEATTVIEGLGDHPLEILTRARFLALRHRARAARDLVRDDHRFSAVTSRRTRIERLILWVAAEIRLPAQLRHERPLLSALVDETTGENEPWLFTLALADRRLIDLLAEREPRLERLIRMLDTHSTMPAFPHEAVTIALTPRERQVLRQIMSGASIDEIAEAIHVSPSTVRNHRKSLYRKLGVRSRQQAIEVAAQLGVESDLPSSR